MGDLVVERDGSVVTLTINRPEAGNSFSRALLSSLGDALGELAQDRGARAVIVIGAGEKVFCAGADLKERADMSPEEALETVRTIRRTISELACLPVPTIAAVNGHALGGGLELALACDIRVVAPHATLGLTETSLGIIPGGGGTQRLSRLIGVARAKELVLTARRMDADEACRIGLVAEIADPVLERAQSIASRIAENAPIAVRAAKEAIDRGLDMPLDEALVLETGLYERTIDTQDRLEGLAAFREKRKPVYRGE